MRIVLNISFANFWQLHDAYSSACGFGISTWMLLPLACTKLNFRTSAPCGVSCSATKSRALRMSWVRTTSGKSPSRATRSNAANAFFDVYGKRARISFSFRNLAGRSMDTTNSFADLPDAQ